MSVQETVAAVCFYQSTTSLRVSTTTLRFTLAVAPLSLEDLLAPSEDLSVVKVNRKVAFVVLQTMMKDEKSDVNMVLVLVDVKCFQAPPGFL
jgi:hypothetical protein